MIDDPDETERLLAKLDTVLPAPARMTPELAATLQARDPEHEMSHSCTITWISGAGHEGGIVWWLGFAHESKRFAFASITHLGFHANLLLARDIAAHQRHRVKRLRRQLP
jgi:hypothetical protein